MSGRWIHPTCPARPQKSDSAGRWDLNHTNMEPKVNGLPPATPLIFQSVDEKYGPLVPEVGRNALRWRGAQPGIEQER